MTEDVAGIDVRPFGPETEADAVAVANRYLSGWRYTRPLDGALLARWKTLPEYQPQNMLVAYRQNRAVAFLHGRVRDAERVVIPLLAVLPGEAAAGEYLLRRFEETALAAHAQRLIGPSGYAVPFYAGYVLGREPYHPHWAADATEAYVRAGFRISHPAVILVADVAEAVKVEDAPRGYEIVEAETKEEYTARAFGLMAVHEGQMAARCYARLYPEVKGRGGRPVGQLGHVGTEEQHQGRGLARVLCLRCLERLREWGAGDVLIATGLDNYPALRVYERIGAKRWCNINEWSKQLVTTPT